MRRGRRRRVDGQRQLLEEIAEYRQAMTELDCFGDGSLFSKVLKNTLTPEQTAVREKAMQRCLERPASVDDPLGGRQPGDLAATEPGAAREARGPADRAGRSPPRKFGEYDYYGLMFQVSKLPEKELKPIFDESNGRRSSGSLPKRSGSRRCSGSGAFCRRKTWPMPGKPGGMSPFPNRNAREAKPHDSSVRSTVRTGHGEAMTGRGERAGRFVLGGGAASCCSLVARERRLRRRHRFRRRGSARPCRATCARCMTAACSFWRRRNRKTAIGRAAGARTVRERPAWR